MRTTSNSLHPERQAERPSIGNLRTLTTLIAAGVTVDFVSPSFTGRASSRTFSPARYFFAA